MPRPTPKFLDRPRLTSVLDAADTAGVVLVSAPAGYGKTLLLAEWAAHRGRRTTWLTLDGDDNVDRRFWAGMLAALDTDGPLCTLPLGAVPSRDPRFLEAVTAAISAARPVTLVLDDVHILTARDPLHGLAALLRDRPPGLQLVLAARSDPPLRLERLRLSGRLAELRARALAFSPDETAALLVAEGVALRPDQLENLLAQTEGWAAGLRLAVLALAHSPDPDAVLRDLVGNGPALADYLVAEVLSRLPEDVVDVLAAVSVCDRVSAPLAVTLAERMDAGDVLADLERTTSLMVADGTGRQWFRLHPLLRAQLRADLQRQRPDRLALLHGRAAYHRSASGDTVAALRHAGLAGDDALLAGLLHTYGPVLATSGQHAAVLAALDALPPVERSDDVRLMLVAALAHLEVGHRTAATRLLERAEAAWPDAAPSDLEALRTTVRIRQAPPGTTGGVGEAVIDTAASGRAGLVVRATVLDLLQAVDAAAATGRMRRAEALARAAVAEAVRNGERFPGGPHHRHARHARRPQRRCEGIGRAGPEGHRHRAGAGVAGHRRGGPGPRPAGLRGAAPGAAGCVPAVGNGRRPRLHERDRSGRAGAGRPARRGDVRPRGAPGRAGGDDAGAARHRRPAAGGASEDLRRRGPGARCGGRARLARSRPGRRGVGGRPARAHRRRARDAGLGAGHARAGRRGARPAASGAGRLGRLRPALDADRGPSARRARRARGRPDRADAARHGTRGGPRR